MTLRRYLYIDTATAVAVSVQCGRVADRRAVNREQHSSRVLMPLIKRCCAKNHTPFQKLSGIGVVSGPGPFTSLRVGVATANALGFALDIPVVGVRTGRVSDFKAFVTTANAKLKKTKLFTPVKPYYGRAPHITKRKGNSKVSLNLEND